MEINDELLKKLSSISQKEPQKSLRKVILKFDDISGGKYEGEVNEKGQWHGYGIYTDKVGVGRREEGLWKNGLRHGHSIITYHDGEKYVGEFKDGEKNGQGTETLPSGQKYVGEWKDGKKNGQGTETFPDGSVYVGEFKVGLRNGQGTMTFIDGRNYIGEWKDGIKI